MTQVGLEGTGELVGAVKKSVDESGTEIFAAMIAEIETPESEEASPHWRQVMDRNVKGL